MVVVVAAVAAVAGRSAITGETFREEQAGSGWGHSSGRYQRVTGVQSLRQVLEGEAEVYQTGLWVPGEGGG